jgi:hypothetical protein
MIQAFVGFIAALGLSAGAWFYHLNPRHQAQQRELKSQIEAERQRQSEAQAIIEQLKSAATTQEARLGAMAAELKSLKETDQYVLNQIVTAQTKRDFAEALAKSEDFIARFPASPLLPEVRRHLSATQSSIAEMQKDMDKKIGELTRAVLVRPDDSLLSEINSAKNVATDAAVKQKLDNLAAAVAHFLQTSKENSINVDRAGLELAGPKAHWKIIDSGNRIGEQIVVPAFKANFKNASAEDMAKLSVKAVFYDPIKKEEFGTSSASVVGYGDTPLRAGFSKFGSTHASIGYKSDFAAMFATLYVDLYVTTTEGKDLRIGTFPVTNAIE